MAQFGSLPEMMTERNPTTVGPFYYNVNQESFYIDEEKISVTDPDVQSRLACPEFRDVDTDARQEAALLSIFGTVIVTPKLYSWLENHGETTDFNRVNHVMRSVFEQTLNMKDTNESIGDALFGFSCERIREGHVRLSVTGNCACCGPEPDGTFVDHIDWDTGFAEYGLHNVDFTSQHIALLAGLGHLALTAKQAD